MPIPDGQSCGNCTFIDVVSAYRFYGQAMEVEGSQIGYCRFGPPIPAQPSGGDRKTYVLGAEWPEVRVDDWCGDWAIGPQQVPEQPTSP